MLQQQKKLPEGTLFAEVPLEAAKSFAIDLWKDLQIPPRIAYADLNSHREHNYLGVKFLPNGAKTAPHPQVVLYVKGPYHVEQIGYNKTDPYSWSTWAETHIDARNLGKLIEALLKAEIALEDLRA